MATTKIKTIQIENSTTPGSFLTTDASNIVGFIAPTTGADRIPFYDDSATAAGFLTLGTNLSITGTTLNATAGAGGYSTVQEEGSGLTARSTINFVGAGFTASDDAGNSRTNVTMDATLNALAAYNTNGILTQTAADTFAGRTITGTTNRLSVTNGDGVSGNPTLDISSSYVGQATITTLGTVTTGTWNASTITGVYGGTGQTTTAVGDLLVGAASNTWNKLTIGSNGTFLKSNGSTASWATIASSDLSNGSNIALLNATQTFSGSNTFSNNITMNGSPSASTDVVTVGYVQGLLQGLDPKASVRVATTTTGTLATAYENGDTVDGVTLATGDRILIKDQSSPAENGIYTVNASGAPTRATDMDAWTEIPGAYVPVEEGTTNADTVWLCTSNQGGTLNTTAITWSKWKSAGSGVDGTGSANQVTYWSDADSITGNSNFIFDGSNLIVGTTTAATNSRMTSRGSGTGDSTYTYRGQNSSGNNTFSVSDSGKITLASINSLILANDSLTTAFAGDFTFSNSNGSGGGFIFSSSAANTGVTITMGTAASNVPSLTVNGSRTSTSANQIISRVNGTFAPTSTGTNTFSNLLIDPVINQTGGHTGITYGIIVNPTITAASNFQGFYSNVSASHYSIFSDSGKVRLDVGSDANWDMLTRNTSGDLQRIANGTTGQVLIATTSNAPSWGAIPYAVSEAYITGQTGTTVDLDAGTGAVTDVDGGTITFTVPTDLKLVHVYRNGVRINRTGTVSRDYSINTSTHVITFATALTTDEVIYIYKYV